MVAPKTLKPSIKMLSTFNMKKIILIKTKNNFMGEMAQIQHISKIIIFTYCKNIIISFSMLPNDKCIRILFEPSYARSPL
jgi:hypothetical protein